MSVADVVSTGPPELAGTWQLDPAHTRLGFLARQFMITTVRGTFGEVVGSASLDPLNPSESKVSVTIQANSVQTGSSRRDAHLRAAFFEVEKYPTIEFGSTELRPTRDPEVWTIVGDLTIRGVTRPVEFTMTYLGVRGDPSGGTRADFKGTAKVNRKDWGVNLNNALEAGGVLVGDHITVELDIQAVKES